MFVNVSVKIIFRWVSTSYGIVFIVFLNEI
nr:MAG TPA: hypothetical protein [Caudoviricetes sp.]